MLKSLDDLLFDRVFQPALNRIPGASPVESGRFCLVGAMLAALASIMLDPAPHNMALWLVGLGACAYLYAAAGRLAPGRGRNHLRAAPLAGPVRLLLVFTVAMHALEHAVTARPPAALAAWAFDAAMLLFLYLAACDTPPPATRRAPRGTTHFA